jgi:hypothetical protein
LNQHHQQFSTMSLSICMITLVHFFGLEEDPGMPCKCTCVTYPSQSFSYFSQPESMHEPGALMCLSLFLDKTYRATVQPLALSVWRHWFGLCKDFGKNSVQTSLSLFTPLMPCHSGTFHLTCLQTRPCTASIARLLAGHHSLSFLLPGGHQPRDNREMTLPEP